MTQAIDSIYSQTNLVPNGDFEEFTTPSSWSYTSEDFNILFKNWFSPTYTSPDLFGPGTSLPDKWAKAGFGQMNAYHGSHYVGFTIYGCDKGKPHCREYLATSLKSIPDKTTKFALEISIAVMDRTQQIREMELYFSEDPYSEKTFGIIPGIHSDIQFSLPLMQTGKWYTVRDTFTMTPSRMKYMTIGNFEDDKNTLTYPNKGRFPFSYYYLDDIKLYAIPSSDYVELPPNEPKMISTEKSKWFPLYVGKTIALDAVYFAFDRYDILPKSDEELEKLVSLLNEYPAMTIHIKGHTDSRGTDEYNVTLSDHRAKAIQDYLIAKGISRGRLRASGFGESQPIQSNQTDEGRAHNRRVEFTIISM